MSDEEDVEGGEISATNQASKELTGDVVSEVVRTVLRSYDSTDYPRRCTRQPLASARISGDHSRAAKTWSTKGQHVDSCIRESLTSRRDAELPEPERRLVASRHALGALQRLHGERRAVLQCLATKAVAQTEAKEAALDIISAPPIVVPEHSEDTASSHGLRGRLAVLAEAMLERFDADGDGALCLSEARALFRANGGVSSKSHRTAAALDRASFSVICSDPTRGILQSDLVDLLAIGGGRLGAPRCCRPEEQLPAVSPGALSAATNLSEGSRPRPQCRQLRQLRGELSIPLPCGLSDLLAMAMALHAVKNANSSALDSMLRQGVLWASANPWVPYPALRHTLGTDTERFPLLWVAAHIGDLAVWKLLIGEISTHENHQDALLEDIEGWLLPSVICLPAGGAVTKDSAELLTEFFEALGTTDIPGGPLLRRCMLRGSDARPLQLLLERTIWPDLVQVIVRCGGGFPHYEPADAMAQVGLHLAKSASLSTFFAACHSGGDAPKLETSAFFGLFRGLLLLEGSSGEITAPLLNALGTLFEAGLRPDDPLGHMCPRPLHLAARRNCVPVIEGLIAAKANPHTVDTSGRTPMEVARQAQSAEAVLALRRALGARLCC